MNLWSKLVNRVGQRPMSATRIDNKALNSDYFEQAKSWADDIYVRTLVSRNRYQLAFIVSMTLCILLAFGVIVLAPKQHVTPMLIHYYGSGRVTVTPFKPDALPKNRAQVESDLVRYVIARESYDPLSLDRQYADIDALSNATVTRDFFKSQSRGNANALVNTLGKQIIRHVHIDGVVFLDRKSQMQGQDKHINLAEINFSLTDTNRQSNQKQTHAFTALVSWDYKDAPTDPETLWRNPTGFTISKYDVSPRFIKH